MIWEVRDKEGPRQPLSHDCQGQGGGLMAEEEALAVSMQILGKTPNSHHPVRSYVKQRSPGAPEASL